ncbi:MAG: dTMP kinase [Proteobacteria bacterium]|nr:dTMP kinase [Pseudomonadota bacterium]MBU1386492.1 dTMP kinase [Pseudomonadota bacterium]MBU1544603.1 dTMP kinase [Pseudomonadota bacterium]MBU2429998.1 dTMP kinase [Pseudomonadota bacterium]MBU2481186.1 dTMP kinase [Pseudomonadota bacterium]
MGGQKAGKFIVFEGIDGSGKSTQIQMAQKHLVQAGYDVYATFEPTDGPVGRLIRQMLSGKVPTDQRTIASLFAADRTDHLMNETCGIKKIVDQGKLVLCDRYYFSSYAYHSQYIDMDWVIHSNALNAQILRPDLTIFIDVDPDVCFQRIKDNRSSFDMYEKMDVMKKVRDNYFKAFDKLKDTEQVVIINGNRPVQELADDISDKINNVLENK